MLRSFMMMVFLTAVVPAVLAQTPKPQTQKEAKLSAEIIAKETRKWDAIRSGTWASVEDLYADDYISVGYAPDLTISRRTKQEMFSQAKLGRADFQLSDFKVITSNGDTAVISFIAKMAGAANVGTGLAIYASSIWVKRKGEWKTIFYQASLMK